MEKGERPTLEEQLRAAKGPRERVISFYRTVRAVLNNVNPPERPTLEQQLKGVSADRPLLEDQIRERRASRRGAWGFYLRREITYREPKDEAEKKIYDFLRANGKYQEAVDYLKRRHIVSRIREAGNIKRAKWYETSSVIWFEEVVDQIKEETAKRQKIASKFRRK